MHVRALESNVELHWTVAALSTDGQTEQAPLCKNVPVLHDVATESPNLVQLTVAALGTAVHTV